MALPYSFAESGNATIDLPTPAPPLDAFTVLGRWRWAQVAGEAVGYISILHSDGPAIDAMVVACLRPRPEEDLMVVL